MNVEIKISTRNEITALPRVLRIILRQGFALRRLVMQPIDDESKLEFFVSVECAEPPVRLVKLLQKQILVLSVEVRQENIAMNVV